MAQIWIHWEIGRKLLIGTQVIAYNMVMAIPLPPKFNWTRQREEAAQMIADDMESDEKIAAKVGCSRRQLARWKLHPEFNGRVEKHVAFCKERVLHQGLARKERR